MELTDETRSDEVQRGFVETNVCPRLGPGAVQAPRNTSHGKLYVVTL